MNSAEKSSDFQIPDGFIIENAVTQLSLVDLDDDSEMWLVRMPSDMDPSTIEKKEIDLHKGVVVLNTDQGNYQCISEKCKMPNLSVVLPEKETRKWTRVKKTIKGSIFVYECCDIPSENEESEIKFVKIEKAAPEIREMKFEATGNEVNKKEPRRKPKSKKHKERSEKHAEAELSKAMECINVNEDQPKKKKKKSIVKEEPDSDE